MAYCDSIQPDLSNRLRSDAHFCDSLGCCGSQNYDQFDCKPTQTYDNFDCVLSPGNDCDFINVPPLNLIPCCGIQATLYVCPIEFRGYVCPAVVLC